MSSSMGRRDVLKKTAVVAAVAWTAPMIVSSKVGASSGGTCPDPGACTSHYLVKIDADGTCNNSFPDNNGFTGCQDLLNRNLGGATILSGGCSVVTVLRETTNLSLKIKLLPGFQVKFALRKQGDGCTGTCSGRFVCDSTGARIYTFECNEYSNMIIVICGPNGSFGSPINASTAFAEPSPLETQSLMTEEAPAEATTTTSEATTTTSTEAPATTEATTTTSEATTTTSLAPQEP